MKKWYKVTQKKNYNNVPKEHRPLIRTAFSYASTPESAICQKAQESWIYGDTIVTFIPVTPATHKLFPVEEDQAEPLERLKLSEYRNYYRKP